MHSCYNTVLRRPIIMPRFQISCVIMIFYSFSDSISASQSSASHPAAWNAEEERQLTSPARRGNSRNSGGGQHNKNQQSLQSASQSPEHSSLGLLMDDPRGGSYNRSLFDPDNGSNYCGNIPSQFIVVAATYQAPRLAMSAFVRRIAAHPCVALAPDIFSFVTQAANAGFQHSFRSDQNGSAVLFLQNDAWSLLRDAVTPFQSLQNGTIDGGIAPSKAHLMTTPEAAHWEGATGMTATERFGRTKAILIERERFFSAMYKYGTTNVSAGISAGEFEVLVSQLESKATRARALVESFISRLDGVRRSFQSTRGSSYLQPHGKHRVLRVGHCTAFCPEQHGTLNTSHLFQFIEVGAKTSSNSASSNDKQAGVDPSEDSVQFLSKSRHCLMSNLRGFSSFGDEFSLEVPPDKSWARFLNVSQECQSHKGYGLFDDIVDDELTAKCRGLVLETSG